MANTFRVGEIEVLVLSDGEITIPGNAYFQTTDAAWEPHKRWLTHGGDLVFPLGCFLIRSGGRTTLIDTGLGAIKTGPYRGGDLFGELAAAGVASDEIDTVFVTHLHLDHCGTIAREVDGAFAPSFPRAAYRWTSAEQAYWSGPLPPGTIKRQELFDAVEPRFQPIEGGGSLAPGVDVIALPGHTPGQAGVVVSSGEQRAFILGDAISCPVQLEETEWSGLGDIDPKLARQTQEAVAREAEASGALLGASHFPGLTFGRVLSGAGRRFWQAI